MWLNENKVDEKFEKEVERNVGSVLTVWGDRCDCRKNTVNRYRREYYLSASHSWGTTYCDWSWQKDKIVDALRKSGATNILIKVRWNYVFAEFDMKKRKRKELEASVV